jgi:hypothetical protein
MTPTKLGLGFFSLRSPKAAKGRLHHWTEYSTKCERSPLPSTIAADTKH